MVLDGLPVGGPAVDRPDVVQSGGTRPPDPPRVVCIPAIRKSPRTTTSSTNHSTCAMEIADPELIQKWLRQQIIFDQATITYRDLAEEASCGVDQARKLLEEFCASEDGKRLHVEPTYLIFGTEEKVVGDCTKILKVESARACELEDFKSKFLSVSCIQIRSISATQAPDPNLLKLYTDARISLKPRSEGALKSLRKESKDVESEPKKESLLSRTPNNKPEEVKKLSVDRTQCKTKKRKDSPDNFADKTEPSEIYQHKLETKHAPKSPKRKHQKADSPVEPVSTVPSKRSAAEVDNRKNCSDKKLHGAPDAPKTAANDASATANVANPATAVEAGEESSSRKRVTKTRIVKKKKIVRVKDKKGYRVNREEIEEVEESYTDWESAQEEEDPASSQSKKKKKPKTSQDHPTAKTPLDADLSTKPAPVAPLPAKKKPTTVKQSKEQSNITSGSSEPLKLQWWKADLLATMLHYFGQIV
ncbi:hypothetical protein VP01_1710g3 [Puccinia sorghi]|uniref:DNA polymerase delta subunit 3 n=1 Tax=Puccinia sorghi TaxID=27349 RepID=A0A0L6VHD8_9BASI|nr:hypothetical protein VP01_1710g3 [Puccinia sorghi]